MFETLVKRVFKSGQWKAHAGACPEASLLAAYVEKGLDARERIAVETHLADCSDCLDQVVLANQALGDRSGQLISEQVDVVISFLTNAVDVVLKRGEIQMLPVEVLTGARGRKVPAPHTARFVRDFDGVRAEVEVERFREGRGEIRVKTTHDRNLLDRMRVTLVRDEREVASFLTESGRVLFEEVEFGRYVLRLRRNGSFIGDISLNIREEF